MAFPSYTYTLANGTTADASQVMQNFNDILAGISDGSKNINVNAITAAGATTLNGAVALGASTSNLITFLGALNSSIPISANNSFDIGSTTLGLASIYLGAPSSRTTRVTSNQSLGASYTIVLPINGPAVNQIPQTDASGNLSWSYRNIVPFGTQTTGYTATAADDVILCDTSGGAWALLLSGAAVNGKVLRIKKTTSDVNAVTLTGTVDGATVTLNTQYESRTIMYNGATWTQLTHDIPSPWIAFTPTGTWNTNTTYTGQWRRSGPNMENWSKVALGGNPNSASLLFNLPTGYLVDESTFLTGGNKQIFGRGVVSNANFSGSIKPSIMVFENGTGSVNLGAENYGITGGYINGQGQGINQATPSSTWAVGDYIVINYTVPIAGWNT